MKLVVSGQWSVVSEKVTSWRRNNLSSLATGHWPLATFFLLAACGFQPLYGRDEQAARTHQIDSVEILTDKGRLPQLLKAEIEQQSNPDAHRAEKLFQLSVNFTESETSLFINPDGTSSRGDMVYTSTYRLTRKRDGKLIDAGTIARVSSYNVGQTADYATFVSREDARKRGILELAQDYKLRLANLLPKLNNPLAQPAPVAPAAAPFFPLQDKHEDRTPGV